MSYRFIKFLAIIFREIRIHRYRREKLATASRLDQSLLTEASHSSRKNGALLLLGNLECYTAQGKQQHA